MFYKISLFCITLIVILSSVSFKKSNAGRSEYFKTGGRPAIEFKINVNIDNVAQTIHSFGASDCWTAKFIGKWANLEKKQKIADWLFSTDTISDGSPKGIGLSMWRFNIGAGSFEQGAESNIPDEWRREECFLNADGSYNWEKQSGQQWFLNEARRRGVKYTLGFSISPPVFYTRNGKAYNGPAGTEMNIRKDKFEAYADFLTKVTKHFKFDYLSPVNEPQWEWGKTNTSSQEGSQARNSEIAALTKSLAKKLKGTASKIVIGEAGQWDFLYDKNNDGRGDQIKEFFSSASENYIGNLPNVAHIISGHGYFTTCPDSKLINVRQRVHDRAQQIDPQLNVWQSEFGILGNICEKYKGAPRNTGIDYGLYVAKVIHHDLAMANVTSWQWWLAMSPYNYSDALIYINDPSGKINVAGAKDDGIVSDSKQLWALGNYSRFIRPGMVRLNSSVNDLTNPETAADKLMVSAFADKSAKKLVLVIINPQMDEKKVVLNLSGEVALKIKGSVLNSYLTNEKLNLKKSIVSADDIKIGPKSILTVVGSYE